MKPWLHKVEVIVDKSIPYILVILLFLIIGEIFYAHQIEPYGFFVSVVDNIVILIFMIDLAFKYMRTRYFPDFFRKHWLEIIAVLPASLFVRLIERFIPVSTFEISQSIVHEATEIKREEKLIAMEVEKAGQISRTRYFLRFMRPLARLPRFVKAFSFYERPIIHIYQYAFKSGKKQNKKHIAENTNQRKI